MGNHQEILLKLSGLSKNYGAKRKLFSKSKEVVHAVRDVSLEVKKGETLGIIGESGCGKSTLGRLITNLEKPTSGEVIFNNKKIESLHAKEMFDVRKQLQIIFQDPYSSLNPRKPIGETLKEPMYVHKMSPEGGLDKRVDELLELVGLNSEHKRKYPHEFSGGQRQRIGIARALSLNPSMIVCDEPVSALDVSVQAQILNLLLDLKEQFNLTLIFIGHGLGAVKYVSDRIAVMYLGRIVEIGKAEQVFNTPSHPYTKALLDSYPPAHPSKRKDSPPLIDGDLPDPIHLPKGCSFQSRCPNVQEKCKLEQPELVNCSEGQSAACHYPILNLDEREVT
ncbi:ABC transporter ATP-binding protein [Alkalihalobacillus trypoxylicola]|uniref:Peptide ABC transporter substrate-binding protein n=1 Tax=Alkalihalobacillus trypoxylicola TaxID=519424 RepID=A0A161PCC0_9BACI|nr:ABC transporter ATP-binding protein [Alkalihalobacillus trypoxylicola]KYG29529.1 peptide ABC transporter substrate-binding protein [Alkalihalobacillus trypoxylicola]